MLIYHINSNFDLFRFKDFDNHDLSSPSDIQKHLLKFSFFNINIRDLKGDVLKMQPNESQFEDLFYELSDRQPYDFFNMLISIYPSVIFATKTSKVDAWSILKNNFKNLGNEDRRLLKAILNYRLDIYKIESELNAINELPYAKIDKAKVYQSLFTSLYKYLFVLFAKSIDFPIAPKDQIENVKTYHFDYAALNKNVKKYTNALKNSKDDLKRHAARIYINNVSNSAKLDSRDALQDFLSDIKTYTKIPPARKKIFDAFRLSLEIDTNSTHYRCPKILKPTIENVIVPLFHIFHDEFYQDRDNLIAYCMNLCKP
ncbi:hypothetical protein [Psychroflexus salis]|uniref:Uncharacterized protein n=1 Tax=Psychroflexus salis TaxID=1526574 RepID=A0A917EAJ9_9FLAO|nr:hypothetical protein [Psychroflexus salis]GGE15306.1 hypothetical protein GCM10010831_15810 [Psychroflexus salis]